MLTNTRWTITLVFIFFVYKWAVITVFVHVTGHRELDPGVEAVLPLLF